MGKQELSRRKPVERTHRQIVRTAQMDGKLMLEIVVRIKAVRIIKALLIFPMAALHLTVVPRGVRSNQFVSDVQVGSGSFKQRLEILL